MECYLLVQSKVSKHFQITVAVDCTCIWDSLRESSPLGLAKKPAVWRRRLNIF